MKTVNFNISKGFLVLLIAVAFSFNCNAAGKGHENSTSTISVNSEANSNNSSEAVQNTKMGTFRNTSGLDGKRFLLGNI